MLVRDVNRTNAGVLGSEPGWDKGKCDQIRWGYLEPHTFATAPSEPSNPTTTADKPEPKKITAGMIAPNSLLE